METVHPMKEEQTFQCQDCGKLCSSYKALVQHRDIRHNFLGRKQIQCDHCTKMFHNNWALKKHLRDVNTPGYKCDKCGKTYGDQRYLKYHQDTVDCLKKNRKGKHACALCPNRFKAARYLQEHIKVVHEGFRYKCVHCDQEFKNTSTRSYHIKQSHPKNAEL